MIRKFEILAPAQNLRYAIEAIKCGADSVYIGCEKLGLRDRTCYNDIEDIKKLVEFAHRYWVRVYVTLNTVIHKENDYKYIQKTINKLYQIGVDAVIFSDMGILTLKLPQIPMYASVNTRCFDPAKINFLHKIGVQRIILPRELSLSEIKDIRKKTKIALEAFIHGGMCVAYTGNCYLTYAQLIKNTNKQKELSFYQDHCANNGACLVNCGNYYNLLDANNKYIVKNETLLNIRNLNLIEKIGDLFKAGINSFKIEGRQRELSYLKNVVAYANKKANAVLKKNKKCGERLSSGTSVVNFEPNLNKTFNKSFTEYFFNGRKPENLNSMSIYGKFIGKVIFQKQDVIKIDTKIKLNVGDRFLCVKNNKQNETINIIDIRNDKYYIDKENIDIKECDLYRILSANDVDNIDNAFTYRYMSVNVKILNLDKTKYKISIKDEDNIETYVIYKKDLNSKTTKDKMLNLFNENKEYEFQIKNIKSAKNINIKETELPILQKQLYTKLRKNRQSAFPKIKAKINNNKNIKYPYEKLDSLENIVTKKARNFFNSHGVKEIELAIESTKDIENRIVCHSKYCIKYEQGYCSKKKRKDTPKEPWCLEDKFGNRYKLQFDCNKCEMNIIG